MKRDVLVKTLPGTSPPQDGKYVIHWNKNGTEIKLIKIRIEII